MSQSELQQREELDAHSSNWNSEASVLAELEDENDENDFNRIEDKFFVKREHKDELMKLIHAHLNKDEYYRNVDHTLIESNYFDTKNLNIIKDHFAAEERFKIRVRRYAPNGKWLKDVILLEVKSKKNGVSRKFRFMLGSQDHETLLTKGFIPYSMDLRHRNSDLDESKLQRRVEKVNRKLVKKGMVPMCSVVYSRDAYEKDGLRVTIDDNLQSTIHQKIDGRVVDEFKASPDNQKLVDMINRKNSADYLLVEVKHGGVIPEWIADFLKKTNSAEVSFSKYCYSVGKTTLL